MINAQEIQEAANIIGCLPNIPPKRLGDAMDDIHSLFPHLPCLCNVVDSLKTEPFNPQDEEILNIFNNFLYILEDYQELFQESDDTKRTSLSKMMCFTYNTMIPSIVDELYNILAEAATKYEEDNQNN